MNVLDQASAIDNKRIQIKPSEEKQDRGRPRISPLKRKNKQKTDEKHVMTDARKRVLKNAGYEVYQSRGKT